MKTVVLSADVVIGGQRRAGGEVVTVPDDFPDAQVRRVLTRTHGGPRGGGGDGRLAQALRAMADKEKRRGDACAKIEGKRRARRDWRGMGRARDLRIAHQTFAKNLERVANGIL